MQKREREARRDIMKNSQVQKRDLEIRTIVAQKSNETMAKVWAPLSVQRKGFSLFSTKICFTDVRAPENEELLVPVFRPSSIYRTCLQKS